MAITTEGDFGINQRSAGIGINETGSLAVDAGSILLLQSGLVPGTEPAILAFGINEGSNGTGLVTGTNSEIRLSGSEGDESPIVHVGRLGEGSLTIAQGGRLQLTGHPDASQPSSGVIVARESGSGTLLVDAGTVGISGVGAFFQVGRLGGTGSATFQNGSSLNLTASNEYALLDIGRENGTGTLLVDNSDVSVEASGFSALFFVGRTGGNGTATFQNGSTLTLFTSGPGSDFTAMQIGREGGTGQVIVDDSHVTLGASDTGAVLGLGQHPNGPGDGTLIVRNGGTIELDSPNSNIAVASRPGAAGTLEILSGGMVLATNEGFASSDAIMSIGDAPDVVKAEVLVSGTGSLLDAGNWFVVGGNVFGSTPDVTGNGLLTIVEGGLVRAADGLIGRGGVLAGGDGALEIPDGEDLNIVDGILRLLPTAGAFDMRGDVLVQGDSLVEWQVSGDGSAAGHLKLVGHDFAFAAETQFRIAPQDGYQFAAGDVFTLFTGDEDTEFNFIGAGEDLDEADFLGGIAVEGQSAGFGYAFYAVEGADSSSIVFEAVNDGAGSIPAILDFAGEGAGAILATYDTATGLGAGGRFGDDGVVGFNIGGMSGGAGDDRLEAKGSGDFALFGLDGADTLIGGSGNDLLDAGGTREGAANFLLGGAGNDTYIVRNASDIVDEGLLFADNAGLPGDFDTIVSHADFWWDFYHVGQMHVIAEDNPHSLSAMIGSLFGSEMVGNSGDNIIFTVGGDNVVRPGDGVDWIALGNVEGFTGTDTLVLEKPAGAAPSWAVVYDFDPGEDKVDVSGLDVDSFAAIQAAGFDDEAGNSYYLLDGGTNILFLVGLTTGDVSAGDFIV